MRGEPSFDGRLVLFAHGQAGQVALSSACAKDAAALVLALAMYLTRRVDWSVAGEPDPAPAAP